MSGRPRFATRSGSSLITEGQTFILDCQSNDESFLPVTIRWFENDVENEQWRNVDVVKLRAELAFNRVSFICKLTNDCGNETKSFTLYVRGIAMWCSGENRQL